MSAAMSQLHQLNVAASRGQEPQRERAAVWPPPQSGELSEVVARNASSSLAVNAASTLVNTLFDATFLSTFMAVADKCNGNNCSSPTLYIICACPIL